MPDEPKPLPFPESEQPNGNWITRNKKLLSAMGIGGLLLLFVIGHKETVPATKPAANAAQSEPAPRKTPADLDSDATTPGGANDLGNRDVNISERTTEAAPQKSKAEDAREQLEYSSLYATNVTSAPLQEAKPIPTAVSQPTAPEPPKMEPVSDKAKRNPLDFSLNQPLYTLPEGTVIETVLMGKLEGEISGPVDCMVTTDVYYPGSRLLIIPQGARVLGEAQRVSEDGQQRLAVLFHRILVYRDDPGATYSIPLDTKDPGLDQQGGMGLTGKVNNHFLQTFAAAGAIGAIAGLSQIGNGSYGGIGGYDSGTEFRNGVSQSMSQSSMRVLDRFLNRLPQITVAPGTRVKIRLMSDLRIPAVKGDI